MARHDPPFLSVIKVRPVHSIGVLWQRLAVLSHLNNLCSPLQTPFADMSVGLQYIGVDGNQVTMRCTNYFGFDNGQTMFDGLWAGGSALTQDFETVLHRNQVRLGGSETSAQEMLALHRPPPPTSAAEHAGQQA